MWYYVNMDELRKKLQKQNKKHTKQLVWGFKHKLVFPYPDSLFDHLRPFCVGGFPASIMLFVNEMCNGHCYDRARLMQLAFEDAKIVHADIESLRVISTRPGDAEHAFVETTDFGGGRTWVVDTSVGLIFDKDFYYKIERPKINHTFSKDFCMKDPEIVSILASDFEKDKYALALYMEFVENAINKSQHIGTIMYRKKILQELETFKKAIGYDDMIAEIDSDMKLMFKDPKKLDEKFGIVRDQYGREISRNGIPNPYYVSREQFDADNAEFQAAKADPQRFEEYLSGLQQQCFERMEAEYAESSEIASRRLEEIKSNPTANFYNTSRTTTTPTQPKEKTL